MKIKTPIEPIREGPPLTIYVTIQRNGYIFALRPRSQGWLQQHYPEKVRVDSVMIGFDLNKRPEFSEIHRSIWEHISQLITGFSLAEINQLGGFIVVSLGDIPSKDQIVYNSLNTELVYA